MRTCAVGILVLCLVFVGACHETNPSIAPAHNPSAPAAYSGPTVVRVCLIESSRRALRDSAMEEWIVQEMKTKGYSHISRTKDWIEVTDQPCTLHDSRHYGTATIRLVQATPKEFTVAVSQRGSRNETICTLPNRLGSHKLVDYALSSSVASLELHLALDVSRPTSDTPTPKETLQSDLERRLDAQLQQDRRNNSRPAPQPELQRQHPPHP